MRLAWLTPFCRGSAIGRFSQAVTEELSKHADIDLWVDECGDLLPTNLRVVPYDPRLPLDQLWPRGSYDLAICNLGDHLGFHRAIFEFSRRVQSIVVLHDYVMHHFFAGYYQLVVRNLDAHLRRIETLYGARGALVNEHARAGAAAWIWETDRVVDFPMFEDCVSGALGVITHSRFLRERVAAVFSGPVQDIELAYPAQHGLPVLRPEDLGVPADKTLLLTIGNANRNKRLEEVIECIGTNPALADRVFYVICGHIEDGRKTRLQSLASAFGIQDAVLLFGPATDVELHSFLTAAGVCINLRNPAMEGGSASLVELMLYGKAGIVSDTGVYAEVPDDCVLKVRSAQEREDLATALSELVFDVEKRNQLGNQARRYAEQNHGAELYVARLLPFIKEVLRLKPLVEPLHRTSRILGEMGIRPEMEIVQTVAGISAEMFCGSADAAPWNTEK